jgi:hypothetical protein
MKFEMGRRQKNAFEACYYIIGSVVTLVSGIVTIKTMVGKKDEEGVHVIKLTEPVKKTDKDEEVEEVEVEEVTE